MMRERHIAGQGAPSVALFGEWNTSNLGDRAIHAAARGFFEDCGWRTRSFALGSLTAVQDDGPPPAPPARESIRAALPERAAQSLRAARQQLRMLGLMPALRRADAICVGGGALLSGPGLHFAQSLAVLRRAALALGKPLLCLGCSADGAWNAAAQRAVGAFASSCALLSPRDAASAQRVAALACLPPAPVFGDFCLSEADLRARAAPARDRLAVNVGACPWPDGRWQRDYEEVLVALVRYWRRLRPDAGTVEVFTTGAAQDAGPARRVALRLADDGAHLVLPSSLEELDAILRSSDLVIALRLHAAVLALARGAAVFGLSHSAKLQEFLACHGLAGHGGGIGATARVVALLQHGDFGALREAQRAAALRSPAWETRRALRATLAGAARASNPGALLRAQP